MDKKIILLIIISVVIFSGCIKTEEQKPALNTSYTQNASVNAGGNDSAKAGSCEDVKELLTSGKNELDNGNYNKSIEYYTKAIELAPNCSEARYMRGFAHGTNAFMEQNDEEYYKAIEDFDKVLEMDPTNPDALFFKGMCLSNLGKTEEAMAVYKNASEANPHDVMAKREYEELYNKSKKQ